MSGSISKGHCCVYAQPDAVGVVGFGIDKLKVSTPIFSLDDWRPWNEKPAPARKAGEETAPAPRLIAHVNGRDVYNGLYYNSPTGRFSADVTHDGADVSLYLTVNPSKLHGGLITDSNAVHEIMQDIRREMRETLRVDFSLPDTNISRIDLAADALMVHPVNHYAELIRGAKARPNAGNEYPNGFRFGASDTWQTCTYDRGLKNLLDEIAAQGLKAPMPKNTHLMRNEARYMTRKYIRRNATFDTFGAMLEKPVDDLYRLYTKATNHFLKIDQTRMVFPSVEYSNLVAVMVDCMNRSERTYINEFVSALTLENPDIYTIDFNELIVEADEHFARMTGTTPRNKSSISRARKKFAKLRADASARRAVMQRDAQALHITKLQELRAVFIEPYLTAS
jgi:hypothetical protein